MIVRLRKKPGQTMIRQIALVAFLVALCATGAPPHAEAQSPGRVPRIGWLGNMAAPTPSSPVLQWEILIEGLRELGYVEGKNIEFEKRWAEGKFERLPDLAAELVGTRIDVLVVAGQQGIDAARRSAAATPTVVSACDPMEALVGSLARPGGMLTGTTCVSTELAGKRLEILKELVPRISRVAVAYNPGDANKAIELREMQAHAKSLGLTILPAPIPSEAAFESAFQSMEKGGAQGTIALLDPFFNFHVKRLAQLAAQHRIPAMYGFRIFVNAGGLISFGDNPQDHWRRVASFVDRILKGAKPGDLPIEQPTRFELIVNLKAAQELGLTIPKSILLRADEVIR